ncbi:hypothetical protein [Vibrio agarivorans]|uniref:YcxB-like protein domain-containing protein n=1 Tax=Vibrio agarivorans TaxID=153622 RepID=A0ABT7Y0E4_9VIBR|nr:hypothetical protein [Vibrio agarivorans]MDN2481498.1 hypothetical protein [Vibrio agarivorans]
MNYWKSSMFMNGRIYGVVYLLPLAFLPSIFILVSTFFLYHRVLDKIILWFCVLFLLWLVIKAFKLIVVSRRVVCEINLDKESVVAKTFSGKELLFNDEVVFTEDSNFFARKNFMMLFGNHEWSRKVEIDGECYYLSGKRDEMADVIKLISGK